MKVGQKIRPRLGEDGFENNFIIYVPTHVCISESVAHMVSLANRAFLGGSHVDNVCSTTHCVPTN